MYNLTKNSCAITFPFTTNYVGSISIKKGCLFQISIDSLINLLCFQKVSSSFIFFEKFLGLCKT